MSKTCRVCKVEKPIIEFTKSRGECKTCRKVINKAYKDKHRDELNKKNAAKERAKYAALSMEERRARNRKRAYGIGEEEYSILLEKCQGVCSICGSSDALVVDHDHQTNEVRGLLCNTCNTGLGKLGDNIETLEKAILYLKG